MARTPQAIGQDRTGQDQVLRFRALVETNGKTATGIEVPDEIVDGLGSGRRPKVRVTIRDHTYRSSIASMGGRMLLGVSAEVREKAGVAAGDAVDVEISLDTAPRVIDVPPDFAMALASDPTARSFFDSLSYSQQRWFVSSIEGAKKAETRQRRIDSAVARLHEHRGQR